jgi:hypothetical protein
MKQVKFLFIIGIFSLMATPLFLMNFPLVKEKNLSGHFSVSPLPGLKQLTPGGWFSGKFQEEVTTGFNENIGLRKSLIRVNNQLDYSLFRIIHAEGFIAGKNGYLYEEDYIREYTGAYFIGKSALDKKLEKLYDVRRLLKKRGIDLILVFEPGKATFFPEYIPSRYNPKHRTLSNYDYMRTKLRALDMNYLDLSSWFLSMKDTSRYDLFPRYGMHWTIYGMTLAVDTLSRYIASVRGTDLPRVRVSELEFSKEPRSTDNDIEEMTNLLFPLPSGSYVYPVNVFGKDTMTRSLDVLVIGDSYYRNIKDDYSQYLFRTDTFWYYNSKVYPHIHTNLVYVDHSNLLQKLEQYQVILLMVSEINLHCGFWNFVDQAYAALHPGYMDSYIYGVENQIRNERSWFRFMVGKAHLESRPLERLINSDARFLMNTNFDSITEKTKEDTIAHIVWNIKNNPKWLSDIVKKSKERNIPLEQMLDRDATFIYEQMNKKEPR